jgi:hypothetical protein
MKKVKLSFPEVKAVSSEAKGKVHPSTGTEDLYRLYGL